MAKGGKKSARPVHLLRRVSNADRVTRDRARIRRVEHRQADADRRAALGARPVINSTRAGEFAKLLMSGVPPLIALRYCAAVAFEAMDEKQREKWLTEWTRSPLVLRAVNELNGGSWQDLPADRRLQLAIDKHLAELAHYLYTHEYEGLSGVDLNKANTAADRLLTYLDKSEGDASSPWARFVQEFMQTWQKDNPQSVPVPLPMN